MKFSGWLAVLTMVAATVAARADAPTAPDVESQLAALVAAPEVTVVHLWAPWCGNCKHELTPEGWGRFVRAHPTVKFVFVNLWHRDQNPAPRLAAAGLAPGEAPANFLALTHPRASSKRGERLETLLGQPIAWVPTTWVFSEGRLCYALNYGEVRFDLLDQLVADTTAKW